MGKVEELRELIETKHPEWKNLSINELSAISDYKRWACEIVLRELRSDSTSDNNQTPKQKIIKKSENHQGHNSTSPTIEYDFIDDPDELLMSVAIRELNKPDPNYQWANILLACKKQKITNKSEVLEKFKQLPTQVLVNLLNKNLQEES